MSKSASANGSESSFEFIETPKASTPTFEKFEECGVRTTKVRHFPRPSRGEDLLQILETRLPDGETEFRHVDATSSLSLSAPNPNASCDHDGFNPLSINETNRTALSSLPPSRMLPSQPMAPATTPFRPSSSAPSWS
jgi:hypothetical protein